MNDAENEEKLELVESSLDENTHAEMLALYRESTGTILFAKTRQWRTLGATCVAHAAIITVAYVLPLEIAAFQLLLILSFLVSSMAIGILVIYQFWQLTEMAKLRWLTPHMSNFFGLVRHLKSRSEANIHRYLLLVVMIISILISNCITYIAYVPKLPA